MSGQTVEAKREAKSEGILSLHSLWSIRVKRVRS